MKSFSFKALALAFVVVAGSANAGITDTVKGYANTAKNGVVNAVKNADAKLFGKDVTTFPNAFPFEHVPVTKHEGGLPVLRSYLNFNNGYARAAVVVAATAAITAAVVKTYKHFTKPAANATEGENVEANEANTEVVA